MLSDGSPTRTFCYITDALSGYLRVLVNGRRGEPYNIGIETPEISMRELAERVQKLARELWGYQGKVVHKLSDEGEVYLKDNPNQRMAAQANAMAGRIAQRLWLGYQMGNFPDREATPLP